MVWGKKKEEMGKNRRGPTFFSSSPSGSGVEHSSIIPFFSPPAPLWELSTWNELLGGTVTSSPGSGAVHWLSASWWGWRNSGRARGCLLCCIPGTLKYLGLDEHVLLRNLLPSSKMERPSIGREYLSETT